MLTVHYQYKSSSVLTLYEISPMFSPAFQGSVESCGWTWLEHSGRISVMSDLVVWLEISERNKTEYE